MVARTDLRPTRADDSLKKLLGKVANPQTTPHGVKVAQPGEYVSFYATNGVPHRWDGDTIAEYDNRIAEGTAAVAAAQAHLAEVEADLAEAKERITASNGDLTLYVERVEAAQAAADTANAALQTLTSELETAQSAVDAVTARTGAVESALVDVDTKASQAASDANDAANAAQNALASSQQVQADAQNALAKAEEAEAKALEAAGIAAGKGKIIYSASEPSGAEASTSNLWIRSSDSKPHRWDGTVWVAVTDKAILDAAQVAANAQTTANKAVADAAAAASVAQAANIAAGDAQRTADGKTVALFGTATPPPAPGVTQGDLYYRTGTDNRIIEHWQWSGSAWVERAIESSQLVNFDAGYITSGYLDVAKRIKAGSIYADKLTVTGELAARVVNAMDAQVKNLVVTEAAILQHTTLLGETVAERLNVTKKLVARDAIVNGTLDVEQLNVTGDMAAQMVSAMSLESKKLIVTEDAILNRATVVQSLVTPELIADKINVNTLGAQLVTSGAIQTDLAANRGIKISNSGIVGYNSEGKQTLNINGATNKIVGEFSTGFYGDPRVNIYNKFNPLWGTAESIIDMQASGMAGVSSYDNAVTRLSSSPREGFTITTGGKRRLILDNRGAVLSANYIVLDGQTTTNDLAVSGRLLRTRHLHAMESGPHTVAGNSFHDANFNFTSTGHRPFIIPSVSFDDAADINISLWNVTNTTARVRVYNSGSNTVRGLYVTIIVLPLER